MAGVVIHLAAADATYDMLGIKRLPLYYAGNIAPDCIHERKNYVREMKIIASPPLSSRIINPKNSLSF